MSVLVKICGVSSIAALDAAAEGGAAWVGFVFFPPSPRYVDARLARDLADYARGKGLETVGVYVDPDDHLLKETAVAVDWVQLHGTESPERAMAIGRTFARKIIKAIPIRAADDIRLAKAYEQAAQMILFDAKPPPGHKLPGGNGHSFEWSLMRDYRSSLPWMLSGGLDRDNLEAAVAASGALIADVSSGIETAPGVKSVEKITDFLRLARQLNRPEHSSKEHSA
ncbi:N-(5'-phosphoribosyl)anthranilate isomerase [alpha proteobacterium Q-1]|nr:N-(5'-phosphoribosyl)anthranilate isomerase [alpha proteobacterium Q-1]